MAVCFLAPDPIQSTYFIPGSNTPANGGQVFFYIAGSSTKQTVYKDNAGATPWTNPIVLDSGGNLPLGGEVWFPTTQIFKAIFAPFNDTDPPGSPYWTKDNLSGMNDVGVVSASSSTFIQSGTGAVSRTVQSKERDIVSALDFPVVGDDSADDNAALQNFLNRGGKLTLGGGKTYRNLAANLTFIANTELYIEKGTTLHLDTTRLTALNVNNIKITGSGAIKSTNLNTTDSLPTNWAGRGIVEFGGTAATPAKGFLIEGVEVYGDFVGTPSGAGVGANDKRRGIAMQSCQEARAFECNVHHTIAEGIWYNNSVGVATLDYDIEIADNRVHDCNHDAISPQAFGPDSFRTHGNTMWNCLNGIEGTIGEHRGNLAYSMIGAGYGFGGNNVPAGHVTVWSGNWGINNGVPGTGAVDFSFDGATTQTGTAVIENNTSIGAGKSGLSASFLSTLILKGNKSFGWGANTATGVGITAGNCTNVFVDGNAVADEGAHSSGGYNIGALGQCVIGVNTAIGVAIPYVNMATSAQKFYASLKTVYSVVSQQSHTGDTNLTVLATCVVKGNSLGISGGTRIVCGGNLTGTAGTKTVNLKYGGTIIAQAVIPAATPNAWRIEAEMMNIGVTTNQKGSSVCMAGGAGTYMSLVNTGAAIATASDFNITVDVTLGSAADTLTLDTFIVEPLLGLMQ